MIFLLIFFLFVKKNKNGITDYIIEKLTINIYTKILLF